MSLQNKSGTIPFHLVIKFQQEYVQTTCVKSGVPHAVMFLISRESLCAPVQKAGLYAQLYKVRLTQLKSVDSPAKRKNREVHRLEDELAPPYCTSGRGVSANVLLRNGSMFSPASV